MSVLLLQTRVSGFEEIKKSLLKNEAISSTENEFNLNDKTNLLLNELKLIAVPSFYTQLYSYLTRDQNCRVIFPIRDLRDIYITLWLSSAEFDYLSYFKNLMFLSERLDVDFPSRVKLVKYEQLVIDPIRYVKQLCYFLGIKYNATMMDIGKLPGFDEINLYDMLETKFSDIFKDGTEHLKVMFKEMEHIIGYFGYEKNIL